MGATSAGLQGDGVAQLLAQVRFFAGLDEATLLALADNVVTRNYSRGQLIFSEGDAGESLLVLVAGRLAVYRSSPGGDRAILTELRPGQVLGEVSLLDRAPRSASVEALESSRLLSLPRATFLDLLRNNPRLLDPLLRNLGGMVRRLTEQATDHVFLDLTGRLAKLLTRLGDELAPGDASVLIDVTQGRLAEMVGGTRQSVNQVLGGFATRGMVAVEGRRVRLVDRERLRRQAGL